MTNSETAAQLRKLADELDPLKKMGDAQARAILGRLIDWLVDDNEMRDVLADVSERWPQTQPVPQEPTPSEKPRRMQGNAEITPRYENVHQKEHNETDFCHHFDPPCQPVETAAPSVPAAQVAQPSTLPLCVPSIPFSTQTHHRCRHCSRYFPKDAQPPKCPAITNTHDPSKPEPFIEYFVRQSEWSANTFGHGTRTQGIVEHIRKELDEVLAKPHDLEEWIDLTMLAMDGFWRHGGDPRAIVDHLQAKQAKNFARKWHKPEDGRAVEHVRDTEPAAPPVPQAPRRMWLVTEKPIHSSRSAGVLYIKDQQFHLGEVRELSPEEAARLVEGK